MNSRSPGCGGPPGGPPGRPIISGGGGPPRGSGGKLGRPSCGGGGPLRSSKRENLIDYKIKLLNS